MKKTICLVAYAVLTSLLDIVIFNGVAGKGLAAVIGGCSIICAVSPLLSGKAGLKTVDSEGKDQFIFLSLLMSNLSLVVCTLKLLGKLKSSIANTVGVIIALVLSYALRYLLDKRFPTKEKEGPLHSTVLGDGKEIYRW